MDKWYEFLALFLSGGLLAVIGWAFTLSNRQAVTEDRVQTMKEQLAESQKEGGSRDAKIAVLTKAMETVEQLAPGLQNVITLSAKMDVMLENAARRLELIESIVFNAVSLKPHVNS
jgi:hypothetical protein